MGFQTARGVSSNENEGMVHSKRAIAAPRQALRVVSNSEVNRQVRLISKTTVEPVKVDDVATYDEYDDETEDDMAVEDEDTKHTPQYLTDAESDEEEEFQVMEEKVEPMSPKWDREIEAELRSVVGKFFREDPDPKDEDTWDVSMVAEYGPEIFNYMRDLEIKYAPYPQYVPDVQSEITWENRATLMNWIVQAHSRFNLLPETLFLAVNLIDRFLSKRAISLSRFQLCGAIALFIAAKYEEINCPSVQQMAYVVSNDYTTEELLKAERFMVNELNFEMGYPGPMSFLRRTSKADDYDSETRTLAKYFLEITIMDPRFVSSPPSWLAAGAHYLARKMLHQGKWTEAHVYYSGYSETQLRPLADVLIDNCIDYKNNHKAIFDKYSERRFKRSAVFVQECLRESLQY
ncbi:hypothetical protein OGAPHI_003865 [Ogataea philodendri]|uniref:Cyclin N-terminal domain-containing protein n=1 Tax=Ogataea philodendri TaxID=1378263 RepID=A0A9P8P5J0_9ASCO|nr:uncharacterized protein OGAPHI_003865 [Ogataea philodendri]KAH3665677.1 hypothetical protein OGAPHI_003865 [Ogataea philodendri]